jgi:hypothetical protein
MNKSDVDRVQTYLRRLFGSERINLLVPNRAGQTVEVAVGEEVIGTIHKDTDDGEVSYAIHLTVLEEDLPPARPSAPPPRPRR